MNGHKQVVLYIFVNIINLDSYTFYMLENVQEMIKNLASVRKYLTDTKIYFILRIVEFILVKKGGKNKV